MEEQRKERTIDEIAAENDVLRAEIERLQQQVDMLRKAAFGQRSEKKVLHNTDVLHFRIFVECDFYYAATDRAAGQDHL